MGWGGEGARVGGGGETPREGWGRTKAKNHPNRQCIRNGEEKHPGPKNTKNKRLQSQSWACPTLPSLSRHQVVRDCVSLALAISPRGWGVGSRNSSSISNHNHRTSFREGAAMTVDSKSTLDINFKGFARYNSTHSVLKRLRQGDRKLESSQGSTVGINSQKWEWKKVPPGWRN